MDMIFVDLDVPLKPHYPVRVVLNNKTFSVFTGDNYDSVYSSFDLKYVKIMNSNDDSKCFMLSDERDASKHVELCVLSYTLEGT